MNNSLLLFDKQLNPRTVLLPGMDLFLCPDANTSTCEVYSACFIATVYYELFCQQESPAQTGKAFTKRDQ